VTDYLETTEAVAAYLAEALEDGDPQLIDAVLEDAARALSRIRGSSIGVDQIVKHRKPEEQRRP
jgi:DNA-binding phage protein